MVFVKNGKSGLRTEVEVRGHHFVVDEPVTAGGTDLGPAPYDLVTAALGACIAITARLYAQRKGWPLEDINVRLRHSKVIESNGEDNGKPVPVDHFDREIVLTGPLTEEQRARILAIAERCPIKLTLERGSHVTTSPAAEVLQTT
jgi:putative redox protein